MSDQSNRNGDCTFEVKELLEIRTRCTEKLEEHVQTLSGVHSEDKQRIQELERELDNCSQEIGIDPKPTMSP
nr:myosin heavy chain-like protein [Ipomoea batatas]